MSLAAAPAPAAALSAAKAAARCPLCGTAAGDGRVLERVPVAHIWAELGRVWGARFSDGVRARHSPQDETVLVECGGCGLHFFAPVVPGDAEFYAELSASSAYYSAEKWEFGVVRDRLARGARVLDVGCGDGNFLRVLRGVAREAVGIDTNAEGVDRARAEGLDARLALLDDFAAAHAGQFDVVCAFHVLEHLPTVVPFLRAMGRCAAPGGAVVVSVPNRLRPAAQAQMEPLDFPPHHLSRWHPRQFERAAREAGFALEDVSFQPPGVVDARLGLRQGLARMGGVAGAGGASAGAMAGRILGRLLFAGPLHPVMVRAGVARALGCHGLAMMAEFRTPARAGG